MVIAHVLSSFHVGGQERVALDLGVGQRARGHRVLALSLAAPPDGPLAGEFQRAGIVTHTVPKRGPTIDPSLPARLAALFGRERVDVVHTHNPQPLVYAGLAGKVAGSVVVQTRHGVAFRSARQTWLVRQIGRLVDARVVVSRELAATLGGPRAPLSGPVEVIENGVDLGRFRPDATDRAEVRRTLGLPQDAVVIGTVSRLVPSKNVAGLVRACAPLLGERRRLVIVGDGPEREALERQISGEPYGSNVHLLGVRHDVPRLLRAIDLFVLFSRTEGHPIVLLEAMATGVPVVATPVGGVPGILEGGSAGFLVPVDDQAALRKTVDALVSNPARLSETGARAAAIARSRYSADRMVDDYLALYMRCHSSCSKSS